MGVFDVSVFVVMGDRQCIPSDEYSRKNDGEGVFVMLTNDRLNQDYDDDNSILIYAFWLRQYMDIRLEYTNAYWDSHENELYRKYKREVFIWQKDCRRVPGAEIVTGYSLTEGELASRCLNGYRQTKTIMAHAPALMKRCGCASLDEYFPALMYAYDTTVEFDGRTYHGYVP